MADLTINFNAIANAVKYRIKVRQTGTTAYGVYEVTSSPLVLPNVACGVAYEGTVQAICSEGTPCDRYRISTTEANADGDANYDDCATGNSASQAIIGSGDFYVCSRTEPVIQGSSSTSVTKVSAGTCVSPSPEEVSGPVYWSAPAVTCPPDAYIFVSCADGTTEKAVSKTIWDSQNVFGSPTVNNMVYKIDFDASGYTCWTFVRSENNNNTVIPIDVDQSLFDNCATCEAS